MIRDMKLKSREKDKQRYGELVRLVNKAEKKAIEFVEKNFIYDSEFQLKNVSSRHGADYCQQ